MGHSVVRMASATIYVFHNNKPTGYSDKITRDKI